MKFRNIHEKIIEFSDLQFTFLKNLEDSSEGWEYWGRANGTPIGNIKSFDQSKLKDMDIFNEINKISKECIEKYFDIYGLNKQDYDYNNQSYHVKRWDYPMHGMNSHRDADPTQSDAPIFTLCGYFNEDYEGGELTFDDFPITVKPKSNSVIIFPSEIFHSVGDLKNNHRYMYSIFIYKKKD